MDRGFQRAEQRGFRDKMGLLYGGERWRAGEGVRDRDPGSILMKLPPEWYGGAQGRATEDGHHACGLSPVGGARGLRTMGPAAGQVPVPGPHFPPWKQVAAGL